MLFPRARGHALDDEPSHRAATLPPSTGMGIVLAVLEPLPQCKNGRDAGSDQCAERKWPGAAGRETATDPGRWHRRRRTLTANSLYLGFRGRFRGLRADCEGSWGRV